MKPVIPEGQQETYNIAHYAPAVVDGDQVFVSGVIGSNKEGRVPEDPAEQFQMAFEAVEVILKAAGSGLTDIVEMTTYHVNLHEHLKTFVEVKDKFIKEPYPAWTAIGIHSLARRKGLVEIKVTARIST